MPYEGDNMTGLRRSNRSACLYTLHRRGSMSRKRLAEILKLTPAAMSIITRELIEEGLLKEGPSVAGLRAGRREILLETNPRSGWALGVMINVRQAIISAIWLDGTVIFSENVALPLRADAVETVDRLSDLMLKLCSQYSLDLSASVGLGIAVRGLMSRDGRMVRDSFGALNRNDFDICRRFEEKTGLPAILSNNVRALFAAQIFMGKEEKAESQFFLRCEYGVGASFAIDSHIWKGDSGKCAEIGHIPVVLKGGKPCYCGKTGCLETVASPAAICEDTIELLSPDKSPVLWSLTGGDPENVTPEIVLRAARDGDPAAGDVIRKAVSALGSALRSVIYVLDPGKVILYGRIFDDPYFLSLLQDEVRLGLDAGHRVLLERSVFNHSLEDKAAGLLAVTDYLDRGATMQ